MRWSDAAADLLWGSRCPGCERGALGLCADCAARLEPDPVGAEPGGGRPGAMARPAWAGGAYGGILAAVLGAVKEEGRHDLIHHLVDHLEAAWIALDPPPGSPVVPVPSRPAAIRRRGADLPRLLAAGLARRVGSPVLPILRLSRSTSDQAGLSAAARRRNLRGAVAARRTRAPLRPVVVLDDVITTGATLAAAVAALTAAGHRVHAAVFAARVGSTHGPSA